MKRFIAVCLTAVLCAGAALAQPGPAPRTSSGAMAPGWSLSLRKKANKDVKAVEQAAQIQAEAYRQSKLAEEYLQALGGFSSPLQGPIHELIDLHSTLVVQTRNNEYSNASKTIARIGVVRARMLDITAAHPEESDLQNAVLSVLDHRYYAASLQQALSVSGIELQAAREEHASAQMSWQMAYTGDRFLNYTAQVPVTQLYNLQDVLHAVASIRTITSQVNKEADIYDENATFILQHFVTVLDYEKECPGATWRRAVEQLDQPIKVKFQKEPYTLDIGKLHGLAAKYPQSRTLPPWH